MADSDQCALNPDGSLKSALEIDFIHNPNDLHPATPSNTQPLSCSHRTKRTDLFSKSVAHEQLSSDIEDDGGFVAPPKHCCACQTADTASHTASLRMCNSFEMLSGEENVTDADDGNFSDDIPGLQLCSDSEEDSNTNIGFNMITNEEVILLGLLLISFF